MVTLRVGHQHSYQGVSISVSIQCLMSVSVSKRHPLFTGNTKQGLIANKKYKSWLIQLGNGLLLLLSLLEKRKYNNLLSYTVCSNPTEYDLSSDFVF